MLKGRPAKHSALNRPTGAGAVSKKGCFFFLLFFFFNKKVCTKTVHHRKRKEICHMVGMRENRVSRGIFLNLIDLSVLRVV